MRRGSGRGVRTPDSQLRRLGQASGEGTTPGRLGGSPSRAGSFPQSWWENVESRDEEVEVELDVKVQDALDGVDREAIHRSDVQCLI